jgi:hypothetical protein
MIYNGGITMNDRTGGIKVKCREMYYGVTQELFDKSFNKKL